MALKVRVATLVIALAMLGIGAVAPVALAAPAVTFQVTMGGQCVFGTAPAEERVHLSLLTSAGLLRGRASSRAESGTYTICFDLVGSGINAGDKLHARVDGHVRSFVIPPVTPSVDRLSDVVSGQAPLGASLQLLVVNVVTLDSTSVGVKVDPTGHYSLDLSSTVDIKGGWLVEAVVLMGSDLVRADTFAPWMIISAGNETVRGYTRATARIDVTIRSPSGHLRGAATTGPDPYGQFIVRLLKPNGAPAYPNPGDTVSSSIAGDAALRVPTSWLRGDPVTDRVEGRCMRDAPYRLVVQGRIFTFTFVGVTRHDGTFARNVAKKIDMRIRDVLQLVCFYPSGDGFLVTREAE